MRITLNIELHPEHDPKTETTFSTYRVPKLSDYGRDTEAEAGRAAVALAQAAKDGLMWLRARLPEGEGPKCCCMYRYSSMDGDGDCTVCGNPWLHADGEVTADEDKQPGEEKSGAHVMPDDPTCAYCVETVMGRAPGNLVCKCPKPCGAAECAETGQSGEGPKATGGIITNPERYLMGEMPFQPGEDTP